MSPGAKVAPSALRRSPAAPRLAPPRQAGVEPGRMLLAPKPALNVGWEQQVLY